MKSFLVVGVISSAKEGSNSAAMIRAALKGAEETGATVRELYLPGLKMGFCTGCLSCMKEGRCFQKDDFHQAREVLYKADGIIWGSPTYAASTNAIMKNLIDRLGMFEVTTSSLGGKYMAGISAASSAGAAKKVAKSLAKFGSNGTFMRSFSSGSLGEGFKNGRTAASDELVIEKARKLGKKVADDIKKGRKYPLQNLFGRLIGTLLLKPVFSNYILKNKDGDTKEIYTSLRHRNLIAG